MKRFIIRGTSVIDIEVEIDAENLEEAIQKCDEGISIDNYCNGTVGAVDYSCDANGVDTNSYGYIEWDERNCEVIDEWDDEEGDDDDEI